MPSLEDLTTDQLLARARELEGSAQLLTALTSNPKTRETVQRALKTLKPDLVIPEIDAKDSVLSIIEEERKERRKLEQQILERDARERVKERREGIKTKYKVDGRALNDTDIEEIEKLMVDPENPIGNHDAAARVYLASRQSAIPTPAAYQTPTYQMPEKEVWGAGIGNPAKLTRIAMDQAYEAWADIKGGKVPGLGTAR